MNHSSLFVGTINSDEWEPLQAISTLPTPFIALLAPRSGALKFEMRCIADGCRRCVADLLGFYWLSLLSLCRQFMTVPPGLTSSITMSILVPPLPCTTLSMLVVA